MEGAPSSLAGFIDEVDPSDKTLLLLNRTGPAPLVDLLERAFADQSVTVAERHLPEAPEDLVCLIDDGEVVATTPLSTLEEAYLFVNVDRYRTGTRHQETGSFPDVLTGLNDVEFTVRGFPESNKEKLLLVVLSRFIESQALADGAGELHTSFQRLSRIDDEYGTGQMYEWLAESDIETHVYGVRDDPQVVDDVNVTVHSSAPALYRDSWLVLFAPPPESDGTYMALVAELVGQNVWRGMWTYDASRVLRVRSYVRQHF